MLQTSPEMAHVVRDAKSFIDQFNGGCCVIFATTKIGKTPLVKLDSLEFVYDRRCARIKQRVCSTTLEDGIATDFIFESADNKLSFTGSVSSSSTDQCDMRLLTTKMYKGEPFHLEHFSIAINDPL